MHLPIPAQNVLARIAFTGCTSGKAVLCQLMHGEYVCTIAANMQVRTDRRRRFVLSPRSRPRNRREHVATRQQHVRFL
jgi:hypothetical protein